MIADDELSQLACPSCGRDPDECGDPGKDWFAQRQVCYVTRERAAVEWLYEQRHDSAPFHDGTEASWATKRSQSHPFHYKDGVTIFVAAVDLNPDDHFLSGAPAPDDDPDGGE